MLHQASNYGTRLRSLCYRRYRSTVEVEIALTFFLHLPIDLYTCMVCTRCSLYSVVCFDGQSSVSALSLSERLGCRKTADRQTTPRLICNTYVSGRSSGICDAWGRARTVQRILTISRAKRQCPTIVYLMPVPLRAVPVTVLF